MSCSISFIRNVGLALFTLLFVVVFRIVYSLWIWPNMVYKKLRRNGLINGPSPSFPFGNIHDMVALKNKRDSSSLSSNNVTISHDIHSSVVPHFAQWQKSHGKNIYTYVQARARFSNEISNKNRIFLSYTTCFANIC